MKDMKDTITKKKRPPTRYGNREDQVLWNRNRMNASIEEQNDKMILNKKTKIDNSLMMKKNNLNINNTAMGINLHNDKMSPPNMKNMKINMNNNSAFDIRQDNTNFNKKDFPDVKVSSDFRKTLKQNLSRNSNKIVQNLKKLSLMSKKY
jgi:hypothetical protein